MVSEVLDYKAAEGAYFRSAARKYAGSAWAYGIIGVLVWYFAGWQWSVVPFGLALYVACKGINSADIADRIQRYEIES